MTSKTINAAARIRRLTRGLFVKVFLWFWVATLVMLGVFFLISRIGPLESPEPPGMFSVMARTLAVQAAHSYENGGAPAFDQYVNHFAALEHCGDRLIAYASDCELYLLTSAGKDALSRPLPEDVARIAETVPKDHPTITHNALRSRLAAYRLTLPSGHQYVLVLRWASDLEIVGKKIVGRGLPMFGGMLIVITLFCLWLAHHITSPIRGIQSATWRFAEGDLTARAPASITKRHDELAALALDFDLMVERTGTLIQAQRNLLSSVSHELRSPLARLNVSLALLRKQVSAESAEPEELLVRMERDVNRVDTLISQLLMLSRLESGIFSGERVDVDFSQLVQEVAADGNFEAQALGKSVNLLSPDSIVIENADPHALRSAIENVVRNAIRFTPLNTDVKMILTMEEAGRSQAVLTVSDHGPGVPKEDLGNIFLPFFRVNKCGKPREGNGLGLAIALEVVRMHHGSICASNLNSSGLEIEVRLPISTTIG